MIRGARLRALRGVGFKSFAEKTVLEFGPGISAVVGPNGSGKSNLADALRWALGEQGRSLRTRKSEDVIFAGSAKRHTIGMADVSLVIHTGGQGWGPPPLPRRPGGPRPLFEEAAGVRRHERRRRQAEERLVEAEAN